MQDHKPQPPKDTPRDRLAALTQKLSRKPEAPASAAPTPTARTEDLELTQIIRVPPKPKEHPAQEARQLQLADVLSSPYQPRKRPLTKKDVSELMASIEVAGQVTPIIVSPAPNEAGKFHVHSGHRRCAALRFLGATAVSAIVRIELEEREARRIAVADNIGREDLTAYEQALALRDFATAFGVSVEDSAQELGVGRRTGYRLKSILEASEELQVLIREHGISAKASEALVKLEGHAGKRALQAARRVAAGTLSLDGLEELARDGGSKRREARAVRDVELRRDAKGATLKVQVTFDVLHDEQRLRITRAVAELLGAIGVEKVEGMKVVPAGHGE